jgi:RNA polymerase sigma factor (sigma-70 family)
VLPAPLSREEENEALLRLPEDESARAVLIEHNLRLVVYIARRFENTGTGLEDLVSIGTVGLIKAINTFRADKNIKLATYASRCIENEILMYIRKRSGQRGEISIDEPLNVDFDGNELLLSDVLGSEEDGVGFIESRLRPWVNNPEVVERADNIPALLDEFIPIIRKNLSSAFDPSQRLSWIYLEHFVPICRYHGEILKAGGNGDLEKAKSIFAELRDYVSEHELEFYNAFDLFLYLRAVAHKIGAPTPKYYD